jgi:hypothetical protein
MANLIERFHKTSLADNKTKLLLGKCLGESISRKHFWSFRVRKHFGSSLGSSKFPVWSDVPGPSGSWLFTFTLNHGDRN